jgi:hypothetical protein
MKILLLLCFALAIAAGCTSPSRQLRESQWYREQKARCERPLSSSYVWLGRVRKFGTEKHANGRTYDRLVLEECQRLVPDRMDEHTAPETIAISSRRLPSHWPSGEPRRGEKWAVCTSENSKGLLSLVSAVKVDSIGRDEVRMKGVSPNNGLHGTR